MRAIQLVLMVLLLGGFALAQQPAAKGPAVATPPATTAPDPDRAAIAHALPTEEEVRLGREGSAEAEREYKLVNDPANQKRVDTIAREIIDASEDPKLIALWLRDRNQPKAKPKAKRVPFAYSFKILDAREVNAFSFAGGPIYVTTGLLEYCRSDHELAAVIAHEVAHVAHHHLVQLIERQSKTEKKMLWLLLAGVLAGGASSPDFGNVLVGAQLYSIAKANGYGREAEKDADRTGLQYMLRTRYNPVGMLTVMKRFARDEARMANRDLGIYQSHPYPRERARLVQGQLAEAGIKVNLGVERDISNAFELTTRTMREMDREIGELSLNGQTILRVAEPEQGRTPAERVEKIRRDLQDLFERSLALRQLRLSDDKDQILALGNPVITIYPADAAASGHSVPETARQVLTALQKALWKEQIDLTF
jgi:predicted Zn-dependent protease